MLRLPHALMCAAFCLAGMATFAVAAAPRLDLYAPAMQALRAEYAREKTALSSGRRSALEKVLQDAQAKAEAMQADARKSGNIHQSAGARQASSLCATWAQDLKEKGDFSIPSDVRREVADVAKAVADRKKAIEDPYQQAVAALDARMLERFKAEAAAQGVKTMAEDAVKAAFRELTGGAGAAAPAPATAATSATAGTTGAAARAASEFHPVGQTALPADVLGVSGEAPADAVWISLATWECEVFGIGSVEVPVMNRERDEETKEYSPDSDRAYATWFKPLRVLTPDVQPMTFRVRRMPGREAAHVTDWPQRDNRWTMTVSVKPGAQASGRHGLELQVCGPGLTSLPAVGEAGDAASAGGGVALSIKTEPAGAAVMVDGRVFRGSEGSTRTPCRILIVPGRHDIALKLPGFLDAAFPGVAITNDRAIFWRFSRNPAFVDRTVPVSATAPWTRTGVTLRKGDRATLTATGVWSCGSGGERTDADGYPNEQRYFRYYLDPKANPRQIAGANYGALLARVGKDGAIVAVGKKGELMAAADGELLLDINEADDGRSRRDNSGSLSVRVEKAPGP